MKLVNYAIMPMENWRAREAELAYYREHVPELRNDKARLDWLFRNMRRTYYPVIQIPDLISEIDFAMLSRSRDRTINADNSG